MLETIIVTIIIASALFYIGRKFYRQFFAKKQGCDGCGFS
ncbi:MAG: FeoB-associated Cys-rich membrane protein [Crocinitomicaceae bacterium]|nr:FeoB-associated Cys-rich membrane protein [Crocinitomicaceae bacterium]